jgi:hypothetical protein
MKFKYIKIPTRDPSRKWIRRPIIPITLSARIGVITQSVNIDALLDSGADKCLFNAEIGEALGLDVKSGATEYFGGVEGGRMETFIHQVKIQIRGMDLLVEMPVGFTYSRGVSAILGQDGFFDGFRITFERDRDIVEITKSPKMK